MIAIFSDTHSTRDHELEDEALAAAREADLVLHAGDFTTVDALEAFRDVSERFVAVHGNADTPVVSDRLPTDRVIDAVDGTLRIALTHRVNGGEEGRALFGRAHDADVVVSGHSHRPSVVETDDIVLLNPGSHADPRGNRPGFALLDEDRREGRLLEPSGTEIATFSFE